MGNKQYDSGLLIVDLESTCWDRSGDDQEQRQISEIIEIGCCTLNYNDQMISDKSYLIKPQFSKVGEFCTKLTTITPSMLENKPSYAFALGEFMYFENTSNRVWASWGDYDRKMFYKMADLYKTSYPFGDTHINLKSLFAMKRKHSREVSMEKALEILGIPLVGTHHRGVDDAKNIAKIARWIFWG